MKFNKTVSSLPRKKRLHMYEAGLGEKRKKMGIHASKELRKANKSRTLPAKKGDKVRVLRGEYRKREGKISQVSISEGKIYIEGVMAKKQSGKETPAPIEPSACLLVEWQEPRLKPRKAKRPNAANKEEKKA